MTFRKSKMIDNSASLPALNLSWNVETRCSYRQNQCYVGDRWTHSEKKTGRGRKSLSPSVRDNCRLCVKLVLRWIILEPRTCFSPQSRWARLMWFSQSCSCESVGLSIEYFEPRISRTEFVVLMEGKSPFVSCICLCQAPCLALKTRRVKVRRDSSARFKRCLPTSVSSPDWIPLGWKIQKHVHDSVADEELAVDRQEGQ